MGKRGPNPANSRVYPPKKAHERPKPPVGMALRPRRIWKELVAYLQPDHFRPSDYELLRAYCEAAADHFEASEHIDKEGLVIPKLQVIRRNGEDEVIEVGRKTNPYVAIKTQTAHTMAQLATKLRLTPNARISPDEAGRKPKTKSSRAMLFGEEDWPPR